MQGQEEEKTVCLLRDEEARVTYTNIIKQIGLEELSNPQVKFFDDCKKPLLLTTSYGLILAREAARKLFAAHAAQCTEIGLVYVFPDHRGKGNASRLLAELEKVIHEGCIVVYAQTCIQNEAMAKLYAKAGYMAVFSNPGQHAVDTLMDQSKWTVPNPNTLNGSYTVVLVKQCQ